MLDWGAILAEHGERVWRTVYRLLEHHADALDCYQETFLAALRLVDRQEVADWPSLLVSLATRRAMNRLRQRYRFHGQAISIDHAPEPSSGGDGPVEEAEANELLD